MYGEDQRAVGHRSRCLPVSAQDRRVGWVERDVPDAGAGLGRDEREGAVGTPDPVERPADVDDARLQIEAVRSLYKRQELSGTEAGAERVTGVPGADAPYTRARPGSRAGARDCGLPPLTKRDHESQH